MAYFSRVNKGDKFVPNTTLENTLREMANAQIARTGVRANKNKGTKDRVKVYNATSSDILQDSAVFFDFDSSKKIVEGSVPCSSYNASAEGKTWGVSAKHIAPGEFGSCIVSGPVKVKISAGTGNYVQPNSTTPDVFTPSDNGVPILYREGSYAIINLGGGESSERKHQFQVIDISETSSDGTVTLEIRVQNGHNPDSRVAGTLNGDNYDAEEITLAAGTSEYYVYALNGVIYALNHEFQSDFFPVLRLATVTVVNSKLTITQENFQDDPIVPVCGSIYGAITLTGTVDVESYVATASYQVAAKGMLNNIELPYPDTGTLTLPKTDTAETYKYLLAYINKINVENDAAPVAGFEISSSDTPSTACEWHELLLQYSHTAESFHVKYRSPLLHMFTFTMLYLNHNEASDD